MESTITIAKVPEKNMITEWKRYYTLWRQCNLMYEEWLKTQGLSMNGYLILYSFYDETDAPTQKSISQKWMIPKQTVNTILKDYMQKGFIEAVSMPEVLWSRLSDFFAKEK